MQLLPRDHLEKRSRSELGGVPEVRAPFPPGRAAAARISARSRRWTEHDADLASSDPLHFTDTKPYAQRLQDAQRKLGVKDAIVTAEGTLNGRPVICCSMEFGFIGGTMGAVVGEKVTRAIERSLAQKQPLVIVSCSGGARMMEGAVA